MNPGATTHPLASISLFADAPVSRDANDAITAHSDIPGKPRVTGAVYDVAVPYQQVVRGLLPSNCRRLEDGCGTPPGIRIEASWPCSSL